MPPSVVAALFSSGVALPFVGLTALGLGVAILLRRRGTALARRGKGAGQHARVQAEDNGKEAGDEQADDRSSRSHRSHKKKRSTRTSSARVASSGSEDEAEDTDLDWDVEIKPPPENSRRVFL